MANNITLWQVSAAGLRVLWALQTTVALNRAPQAEASNCGPAAALLIMGSTLQA